MKKRAKSFVFGALKYSSLSSDKPASQVQVKLERQPFMGFESQTVGKQQGLLEGFSMGMM